MENNETLEKNGGLILDAKARISNESEKQGGLDVDRAYIDINKEGWITATIHISKGLYAIIGFLAEVEDNIRVFYRNQIKKQQESQKIVKPGFRGFNPFSRPK